jgi:hypothetical protein
MKKILSLITAIAISTFLTACDGGSKGGGGGHSHAAPHGGTLVELGSHQFNLEFVLDAAAGKLTAYVLDGHAEGFVRITSGSWEVQAKIGDRNESLKFSPQANTTTGEIIGNTATFAVEAEWLKTTKEFEGIVKEIVIREKTYKAVTFKFPK